MIQTKYAGLQFHHAEILNYKPPKTRRKLTDTEQTSYDKDYNLQDGIVQDDDLPTEQE